MPVESFAVLFHFFVRWYTAVCGVWVARENISSKLLQFVQIWRPPGYEQAAEFFHVPPKLETVQNPNWCTG